MTEPTRLKQALQELGMSQAALARKADLHERTISLKASGLEAYTEFLTIKKILDVVNAARSERGWEPLSAEDLGLHEREPEPVTAPDPNPHISEMLRKLEWTRQRWCRIADIDARTMRTIERGTVQSSLEATVAKLVRAANERIDELNARGRHLDHVTEDDLGLKVYTGTRHRKEPDETAAEPASVS